MPASATTVVMKANLLPTLAKDNRLTQWKAIADNCQTAFGEHRDPRVLVTNRPFAVADRLSKSAPIRTTY